MDLIDSLVRYVKEIKPYHTKIYGVDVEYRTFEDVNVSFEEDLQINVWLGTPLKDMSTFPWTLDGLNLPDVDLSSYVEYHGWDSSEWEEQPWDLTSNLGEPYLVNSGLMYENIIVSISENLSFEITKPTTDLDECDVVIGHPWDRYIDGIEVVDYTSTSIILQGDMSPVLSVLTSFDIEGSDVNDGTYGIVSYVYDSNVDRTTVTVTVGPDPNGSGGKAVFGFWDGLEWDGNSFYFDKTPEADFCAQTCFNEELRITTGYGWDDNLAGGWDNVEWDHAELQLEYFINNNCDIPIVPNPPTDQTSDDYWNSDDSNTIPYTWNVIDERWEHAATNSVWEFALVPKSTTHNWVQGLRASVLRLIIDPGPDEGNAGFLFGNVLLYDIAGNQVGIAPFNFVDYNDQITVDIDINNAADLDYGRLLFETFLYTTGPRIYYIEFDPE